MARRVRKKKQDDDFAFNDDDFLGGELNESSDWVEEDNQAPVTQSEVIETEEEEIIEEEPMPGQLAVDVFESKENLFVRARVAGVTKTNLDVTLSDNKLTISGSLEPSESEHITGYFTQECYWGQFVRELSLPVQVKEEDISAELKEGVLTIKFTKVKQDIVRKINVA